MKATYVKSLFESGETLAVYKYTKDKCIGIFVGGTVNYFNPELPKDNTVKSTAKEFNEFKAMAIQKLTKA